MAQQLAVIVAVSSNEREYLIAAVSKTGAESFIRVNSATGEQLEHTFTKAHRGLETQDGRWTWLNGRGSPASLVKLVGPDKCGLCKKEAHWESQFPGPWKMAPHGYCYAKKEKSYTTVDFSGSTQAPQVSQAPQAVQPQVPQMPPVAQEVVDQIASVLEQAMSGLAQQAIAQLGLSDLVAQQVAEELKKRVPVEVVHKVQYNGQEQVIPASAHYLTPVLLKYVAAKVNVFLVGPAGSGKTSAAAVVAKTLQLDFYPKSMSVSDDAWTLVGHKSVTTGEYVPGVAYKPYKEGGILLLDEVDSADPSAMVTLNAMLANGQYLFPNGELVEQHPDFICIAAGNTYGRGATSQYVGRNPLDAATLDRFAYLVWDYDEAAEASWMGATPKKSPVVTFSDTPEMNADEWLSFVQAIRHSVIKHGLHYVISPRASINGAKLLKQCVSAKQVADSCVWKGMPVEEQDRVLNSARPELVGALTDSTRALLGLKW